MASFLTEVTALSSILLRAIAYIFFRWIPGHQLVPAIYTVAVIHVASFLFAWKTAVEAPPKGTKSRGKRQTRARNRQENGQANTEPLRTKLELMVNGHTYKAEHQHNGSTLRLFRNLLLGLPEPQTPRWTLATLFMNILLVLGVLDVVYRGKVSYPSHDLAFTRVGYVSETSAKILIREPHPAQLPIYISYRGAAGSGLDESWKSAGQIYLLSTETDYTYSQEISRLRPSTRYQYAVSNNHSGFFTTAAPSGQNSPGHSKFTFLTSSCIKSRFPYNPFANPLTVPGLRHLAKWTPELKASFMLFLGDFIYVDVPHRFGTDVETYRREYRQVYASPEWSTVSKELPWLHVIDDHEIANDWDKKWQDPYPAAIDPWDIYHNSLNPPPAQPNASYFEFTQGPASFFMMDTRRYRDRESTHNAHSHAKTMLGATQLEALLKFIGRNEPAGVRWKFVVSSVPFTRNWRLNAADTWGGYIHERRVILEAMWDVGIRGDGIGVVVLSGDRHEFAATAFPPPKDSKWPISATVHEFSTSPLSMFYLPFRSYWEKLGEDDIEEVCIKYAPDGNSKFGAVEMEEVKGGEQGLLRFRLFVDGAESWNYVLMTPPAVGGGGRAKDAIWG
ncbi:hypothetical protein ACLMJK_001448 [Lecanora helva]